MGRTIFNFNTAFRPLLSLIPLLATAAAPPTGSDLFLLLTINLCISGSLSGTLWQNADGGWRLFAGRHYVCCLRHTRDFLSI